MKEKIEKQRTRALRVRVGHRHSQCIACLFFDSISYEQLWFIRKYRKRDSSDIWNDGVLQRRKALNLLNWAVRSPSSQRHASHEDVSYAHRLRRKSRHRAASLVKNYANRPQKSIRIHPLHSYHSAMMTGAVLSSATSIEKGENMGIATRQ